MEKNYGSNVSSIIAGLSLVFLGLIVAVLLIFEVNTLINFGFFSVFIMGILGSITVVFFGGYLVGKYVEKDRHEKKGSVLVPPPP